MKASSVFEILRKVKMLTNLIFRLKKKKAYFTAGYSPFLKSIFIFLMAITVLSGSIERMVNMKTPLPLFITGQSATSLLLAFDSVMCHNDSHLSRDDEPVLLREALPPNTHATTIPLFEIILKINKKNNITDYCSTLTTPYVIPENTWRWLIQFIFTLYPMISLHALICALVMVQFGMLWFFFYYLSQIKMPGIGIFILALISISSVSKEMPTLIFNPYSFLLPGLLSLIALFGFALLYQSDRRRILQIVFPCVIGAYLFFLSNLRTSYSVPAGLILSIYYVFLYPMIKGVYSTKIWIIARSFSLTISAVLVCYFFIQTSMFPSELKKNQAAFMTTHVIAHPLVLSLAIPENNFAKKQGIEWLDAIGPKIALTVDPTIDPTVAFTPQYERALVTYYKSLWRQFPTDMLKLYYVKFKSSGYHFAPHNLLVQMVMFPLNQLNGIIVFFIQVILLFFLFRYRKQLTRDFLFATFSFSLIGLALYFESGIIYSVYNPCYHAFLTVWLVALNLVFVNLIWNAVKFYYNGLHHMQNQPI